MELDLGLCLGLGQSPVSWVKAKATRDCRPSRFASIRRMHYETTRFYCYCCCSFQTFANPEDLMSPKLKVKFDDPNVERVRRAHRNDLENIVPFFVIGLLYTLTNPSAFLAINLFRAVGIARIAHTLVYAVVVVPQPARALAFFVALLATVYMALQVVIAAAF